VDTKIPIKIKDKIRSVFTSIDDLILARAPGRINLIGEHTDYNKGLVLPASIDTYLYVAIRFTTEKTICVHALDLGDTQHISLDKLELTGTLWVDYLIGLLLEFKAIGVNLKPFECTITSEVPIGAGVSSSAALDCAFLIALNALFETHLSPWDLVHMSNRSNNNFLGIKSGILDQFASIFGEAHHILFLDCDNLEYKKIELVPSDYTWLLINTCVKHTHLTSGYNDRVNECKQALSSIQSRYPWAAHLSAITSLGQLSEVDFENSTTKSRAEFICEENARVRAYMEALHQGDLERCGELLYASHDGLSNKYEVSCSELDFLVELFRENDAVLGSRMMGGGFGGCTLNLVHRDAISDVQEIAKHAYFDAFGIEAEFIVVNISGGAEVLSNGQ